MDLLFSPTTVFNIFPLKFSLNNILTPPAWLESAKKIYIYTKSWAVNLFVRSDLMFDSCLTHDFVPHLMELLCVLC